MGSKLAVRALLGWHANVPSPESSPDAAFVSVSEDGPRMPCCRE